MAEGFELQNKVENLTEHYIVIRQEIADANKEANESIVRRDTILEEERGAQERFNELQETLQSLSVSVNEMQNNLKNKIEQIAIKEKEIESIGVKKHLTEKLFEGSVAAYKSLIRELLDEIDSLNDERASTEQKYESEILKAETRLEELFDAIDNRRDLLSRLGEDVQFVDELRTAKLNDVNRQTRILSNEWRQIEEEKSSMTDVKLAHADREEELTKRERDVAVMARRVKKLYATILPDVKLTI